MVVYAFYIFDRHTECIYAKNWVSVPGGSGDLTTASATSTSTLNNGSIDSGSGGGSGSAAAAAAASARRSNKVSSDDTKLIFGTIFSLRNMVRKLGGDDDAFISYRTATYKLHYYETASCLRFVMLTDTTTMSMRNVMHQIYINLWVEYVVKNPLSPVEHPGGEGVRNELFELGLDQFVRGLL